MEVSIYINVYLTGHFKKGTGTYCTVLEYIKSNGDPVTREYINGVKGTTKNRTALIACISALKQLIMECNVKIYINSVHITQEINTGAWFKWIYTGINAKGKPAKNMDLWQQLFEMVDKQHTEFTYVEKNSYTDWMLNEMKRRTIEYKEDKNEDYLQ